MKRAVFVIGVVVSLASAISAAEPDPSRVFPGAPGDLRLGKPKDLNGYFPMAVPASKQAWEQRRKELREQVMVANGVWPMPEKPPLRPVVHGKIEWDDYTVEKVYFASLPGHYVTGNLYRPRGKEGKHPGVLCPHGHWPNGRFFEAPIKTAQGELKSGAEFNFAGAIYPLQARCATLARMGCVVFHYDMVGYADSLQIPHRTGFTDLDAELRLQSFMGLQTWNSIRALDFLLDLPDVDKERIGVTGASGGGTQTFVLCGIDDRPTVAFPAVMVSTAMQGGCICENASYLRVGAGNIDLAALFAPKPLAMSGARDWTIDIEKKGLPELKKVYKLYDVEDRVHAKCLPEFGHNYNHVSRELMYTWFNKHLKLGLEAPAGGFEKPFVGIPPKQLAVFDNSKPLPKDATDAAGVRKYLSEASDKQMKGLSDEERRKVVGTALRVMISDKLPAADEIEEAGIDPLVEMAGVRIRKIVLSRKGQGEQIPALGLMTAGFDGTVVVWVHPEGKASLFKDGKLTPVAKQILDAKAAILAPDVLGTGELRAAKPVADKNFAGFTFGYNRSLLGNRAHDILTAVGYAKNHQKAKAVHLIGVGSAGPWVVLARGLCGDSVVRTAADLDTFSFTKVKATDDPMMLSGAIKYGGLPAFATLAAPGQILLHNAEGTGVEDAIKAAYTKKDAAEVRNAKETPEAAVKWLLR
jgi:dienelactone hydrolase